jgi:hypothetical protein
MKKLLPISIIAIIAAVVMIACNRRPETDANGKVLTHTDTLGLADFQKWKAQNELKDPTVYYNQGNEIASNQPTRTIVKYVPVRRSSAHSTSRSYNSGSMNSVSQYPAKSLKRGWSRKAKGAVIGGGSGAILGAVISKNNRLVGGALGGALGAGLGYVIGNELDGKHGR